MKKCTGGSTLAPQSVQRMGPEQATASQAAPGGDPSKRQQRVESVPHLLLPTRQPPLETREGRGRKAGLWRSESRDWVPGGSLSQ